MSSPFGYLEAIYQPTESMQGWQLTVRIAADWPGDRTAAVRRIAEARFRELGLAGVMDAPGAQTSLDVWLITITSS